MHPGGMLGGAFGFCPLFQHRPLDLVQTLHHAVDRGVDRQFHAVTIGVEEIDTLKQGMIDRPNHLDVIRLQLGFCGQQLVLALYLKRDVCLLYTSPSPRD